MKTWQNPSFEELDVKQTQFGFSGNVDDGFSNGLTGETGMDYDPGEMDDSNDITDQLS